MLLIHPSLFSTYRNLFDEVTKSTKITCYGKARSPRAVVDKQPSAPSKASCTFRNSSGYLLHIASRAACSVAQHHSIIKRALNHNIIHKERAICQNTKVTLNLKAQNSCTSMTRHDWSAGHREPSIAGS